MKFKAIIVIIVLILMLLIYLERFFPSKKGQPSTVRQMLESLNNFFFKKSEDSKPWTLRTTLTVVGTIGLLVAFIIWDSLK